MTLDGSPDLASSLSARGLADAIERLVLSDELRPGARLGEESLARRFGVGRGPLREAIRIVEARGFVTTIRNRGSFVREVSDAEAMEIYDLRSVIFGLVGRYLAERTTPGLLRDADALIGEMAAAVGDDDVEAYYPLNLSFHRLLVDHCGNATLAGEYFLFAGKLNLHRTRSLVGSGGMRASNAEHAKMIEAVRRGDPGQAERAFRNHVETAKRRLAATLA